MPPVRILAQGSYRSKLRYMDAWRILHWNTRHFSPSLLMDNRFLLTPLPMLGPHFCWGLTCRMSNICMMDEGSWDCDSSNKSPSFTFRRTRSRKPSREIWRMVSSWPWRWQNKQSQGERSLDLPQSLRGMACIVHPGWGGQDKAYRKKMESQGLEPIFGNESFLYHTAELSHSKDNDDTWHVQWGDWLVCSEGSAGKRDMERPDQHHLHTSK